MLDWKEKRKATKNLLRSKVAPWVARLLPATVGASGSVTSTQGLIPFGHER